MKSVTIKIDENLRSKFKERCRKEGRLIEYVITELIRRWIDNPDLLSDAAVSAGRSAPAGNSDVREFEARRARFLETERDFSTASARVESNHLAERAWIEAPGEQSPEQKGWLYDSATRASAKTVPPLPIERARISGERAPPALAEDSHEEIF